MTKPALDDHYYQLLGTTPSAPDADYARLVTPNSNDTEPFHRWFHMKEAFSAGFLEQVVKDCGFDDRTRGLRILDPFAGSGTIAVSASILDREAVSYGVECNPFLHLLASTKQRALQDRPQDIEALAADVTKRATERMDASQRFRRPGLSTFRNSTYFNARELRMLLALVSVLDDLAPVGESVAVDLLRIAVAGSTEPVSKLRRDGRALRHWPEKTPAKALIEFSRRVKTMATDLATRANGAEGRQILGDSRSLDALPDDVDDIDLAVFSPPYPNNIDYTEVYKLEAWVLGLISDSAEFREQRLRTLHSHPSIRRTISEEDTVAVSDIVGPVAAQVPDGRYQAALVEMVTGYVADMSALFSALATRVRPGGRVVFAVGNSAHGRSDSGVVVASDVLLTAAAAAAGFKPDRIAVARQLTRRQHESGFLRESVCFLTRPESGVPSG